MIVGFPAVMSISIWWESGTGIIAMSMPSVVPSCYWRLGFWPIMPSPFAITILIGLSFRSLPVTAEQCRQASLIYLVDRVDALRAQHLALGGGPLQADHWGLVIAEHAGLEFDPALSQLFQQASNNDAFWMQQDAEVLDDYLTRWAHGGDMVEVEYEALLELAFMFASIVDKQERIYLSSLVRRQGCGRAAGGGPTSGCIRKGVGDSGGLVA